MRKKPEKNFERIELLGFDISLLTILSIVLEVWYIKYILHIIISLGFYLFRHKINTGAGQATIVHVNT